MSEWAPSHERSELEHSSCSPDNRTERIYRFNRGSTLTHGRLMAIIGFTENTIDLGVERASGKETADHPNLNPRRGLFPSISEFWCRRSAQGPTASDGGCEKIGQLVMDPWEHFVEEPDQNDDRNDNNT